MTYPRVEKGVVCTAENTSGDLQVLDNWTNFRQYGLPPPAGLLRMDAHTPAYRLLPQGFLDAVVCDPPYGVRAGGRRSLSEKEILQQKKLDKARVGVRVCCPASAVLS